MAYLIKPNFTRFPQQITLPVGSINKFMRQELHDNWGFYQRQFGIYSWMRLTKKEKYVLHDLKGSPMMWQPHKSCSWDDTGSLRMGKKEFTPCNAKINESYCYDEHFDNCFEQFLSWTGSGPIQLDANGVALVNAMIQTLGENATLGAILTLTAGQMFDPATVQFGDNVTSEIKDLFTRTVGTCRGWVELLKEMALQPKHSHLNVEGIFDPESHFLGDKFIGDPIAVFDKLRDSAPHDLKALLNEGGIIGSINGSFAPIFKVSTSLFNAIAEEYRKLCVSVTCMNPRLSRREYNMPGSTRPIYVYFIDDIPVVPVSHINYYDRYLTGSTHFAAITAAGNVALGGSFAELPDVERPGVGMMIERETSAKDYGKYYFLAHALFSTVIADTDFITATQIYVEPVN